MSGIVESPRRDPDQELAINKANTEKKALILSLEYAAEELDRANLSDKGFGLTGAAIGIASAVAGLAVGYASGDPTLAGATLAGGLGAAAIKTAGTQKCRAREEAVLRKVNEHLNKYKDSLGFLIDHLPEGDPQSDEVARRWEWFMKVFCNTDKAAELAKALQGAAPDVAAKLLSGKHLEAATSAARAISGTVSDTARAAGDKLTTGPMVAPLGAVGIVWDAASLVDKMSERSKGDKLRRIAELVKDASASVAPSLPPELTGGGAVAIPATPSARSGSSDFGKTVLSGI